MSAGSAIQEVVRETVNPDRAAEEHLRHSDGNACKLEVESCTPMKLETERATGKMIMASTYQSDGPKQSTSNEPAERCARKNRGCGQDPRKQF